MQEFEAMKKKILFIIWIITLLCVSKVSIFASQGVDSPKLANGIYLVYAEFNSSANAMRLPKGFVLYEYTADHLESRISEETDPTRYIVIRDKPSVPVILSDKPTLLNTNDKYEFALQFTLASKYIELMEKFTGSNLNKRAALVIGGKMITIHKLRAAIKNGKFTVTRCFDNGCKVIYQNLVNAK